MIVLARLLIARHFVARQPVEPRMSEVHNEHGSPNKRTWSSRSAQKRGSRIAIIGGSLSGLTAAKEMLESSSNTKSSQTLDIDIFRNIYDPVEPGWVYGKASKPYVDYVPEVFSAAGQDFAQTLNDWEARGLVSTVAPSAIVDLSLGTSSENRALDNSTFYEPVGGAMRLCLKLADELKDYGSEHAKVRLREEWIWSMTAEKDKGWTLLLGNKVSAETQEPYDFVLLSYDFCYRMHHVKSFRELLDSGRPSTDSIIGCFGQLHAAKCVAATFSIEPAVGDKVPWRAAKVHDGNLEWICRPLEVASAKWRRKAGCEYWQVLSKSSFSKARFGPGWDKAAAFKELCAEFASLLDIDLSKHRVQLASPCYHWDLPAPLNRPQGQLGILADGINRLGWIGDFCVEPTTEGCWLAGVRAGQALAKVFGSKHQPDFTELGPEFLPKWEYHRPRTGDVDLASLSLGANPQDSAYRGTCNWEAAEQIMQRRLEDGLLRELNVLWLDHLPKRVQSKIFPRVASKTVGDNEDATPKRNNRSPPRRRWSPPRAKDNDATPKRNNRFTRRVKG